MTVYVDLLTFLWQVWTTAHNDTRHADR